MLELSFTLNNIIILNQKKNIVPLFMFVRSFPIEFQRLCFWILFLFALFALSLNGDDNFLYFSALLSVFNIHLPKQKYDEYWDWDFMHIEMSYKMLVLFLSPFTIPYRFCVCESEFCYSVRFYAHRSNTVVSQNSDWFAFRFRIFLDVD